MFDLIIIQNYPVQVWDLLSRSLQILLVSFTHITRCTKYTKATRPRPPAVKQRHNSAPPIATETPLAAAPRQANHIPLLPE
jgi:hypothetical protein